MITIRHILITAALLAGAATVHAQQAAPDTAGAARTTAPAQGRRGGAAARATDRFIDSDGDGICDRRAQGLGFRRSAPAAHAPRHTHPQGRKK